MKRQFQAFDFTIQNTANKAVDIYIDGLIVDADTQQMYQDYFGDDTSTSYKSFRESLTVQDADVYNVYINSGGGLITDAMAMHDLLIDLQQKGKVVNTIGRGLIASAATFVLMAGKNPTMSSNSWLMIHNASGFAYGDVDDVEAMAQSLRQFNDACSQFYQDRTGLSSTVIGNMMSAETWMTAQQAKDKGFVKSVSAEATFTNSIKKENWAFSNMAVFNSYNNDVKKENHSAHNSLTQHFDDMKKFLQDTVNGIMNSIKGIKAPENGDHQALMNSIATSLEPLNKLGETMDEEINGAVNKAWDKKEAERTETADQLVQKQVDEKLPELIKTAVAEATKGLVTEEEFTKEMLAVKGKASAAKEEGETVKPIGGFTKSK